MLGSFFPVSNYALISHCGVRVCVYVAVCFWLDYTKSIN